MLGCSLFFGDNQLAKCCIYTSSNTLIVVSLSKPKHLTSLYSRHNQCFILRVGFDPTCFPPQVLLTSAIYLYYFPTQRASCPLPCHIKKLRFYNYETLIMIQVLQRYTRWRSVSTPANQALILTKKSLRTVKAGQLGCLKLHNCRDRLCNYNTVEKQKLENKQNDVRDDNAEL